MAMLNYIYCTSTSPASGSVVTVAVHSEQTLHSPMSPADYKPQWLHIAREGILCIETLLLWVITCREDPADQQGRDWVTSAVTYMITSNAAAVMGRRTIFLGHKFKLVLWQCYM